MAMLGDLAFYLILVILLLIFLMMAIKILREYERAVVFTLGRFTGVKGPGLIVLVPLTPVNRPSVNTTPRSYSRRILIAVMRKISSRKTSGR